MSRSAMFQLLRSRSLHPARALFNTTTTVSSSSSSSNIPALHFFQPARGMAKKTSHKGGGKHISKGPQKKKSTISFKVVDEAGAELGKFESPNLSPDRIEAEALKRADSEGLVEWFDADLDEWVPLEDLADIDVQDMASATIKVRVNTRPGQDSDDDEDDNFSDYDKYDDDYDQFREDERLATDPAEINRVALADCVAAAADCKFDRFAAHAEAREAFVLKVAQDSPSVQKAILRDISGLPHLTQLLQYSWVEADDSEGESEKGLD